MLAREFRHELRRRALLVEVEKPVGTSRHRGEHGVDRRDAHGRIRRIKIRAGVHVPNLRPIEVLDLRRRKALGDAAPNALERFVVEGDGDAVLGEPSVGLRRNAVSPTPEERLQRVVGARVASAAAMHLAPEQLRPLRSDRRTGRIAPTYGKGKRQSRNYDEFNIRFHVLQLI